MLLLSAASERKHTDGRGELLSEETGHCGGIVRVCGSRYVVFEVRMRAVVIAATEPFNAAVQGRRVKLRAWGLAAD